MNIAIYGGAFDPMTDAHLAILARTIPSLNIDTLYIEPAHSSYKNIEASWTHRAKIIKGSILRLSPEIFAKIELGFFDGHGLGRQPYAIETLKFYSYIKHVRQIFYIIGTDQLAAFGTWKEKEKILTMAKWVVVERADDNAVAMIKSNPLLSKHIKRFIIFPFGSSMSSTWVRNQLKKGDNTCINNPNVIEYIRQNNLYGYTLKELLEGATKDNLHGETDWGNPVGKEII